MTHDMSSSSPRKSRSEAATLSCVCFKSGNKKVINKKGNAVLNYSKGGHPCKREQVKHVSPHELSHDKRDSSSL